MVKKYLDLVMDTRKELLKKEPMEIADMWAKQLVSHCSGKNVHSLLMSRDAWGYCYPGNYFLRKYLGVDIVLPGDLGLVIPDNSKWQMPKKIISMKC